MRRRAFKWWVEQEPWTKAGVIVLAAVLTVLVALSLLKWAPEWLAQDNLEPKDRAEDIGRNRTALLALLAGIIAVTGAIFTGLSYRLNRAGQITDRFTKAIDQLGATDESGKPKIDVVLGGIYALERIARDSKDDHPQVVEVLTAYIREHARYKPAEPHAPTTSSEQGQDDEADEPPRLATDIQAAMSVLARRDITQDREDYRLNLVGTDLRGLVLDADEGGHLERADLAGAHLEGARLSRANLEDAYLNGAHLEHAELLVTRLEGAVLAGASLEGATVDSSAVQGAYYNDETTWPTPGFPAKAWGAIHVDEPRFG